jgi:prephenate dehydrogenase
MKLQVTIIGLGLIGGSLALAFREAGDALPLQITGVDSDVATREQAYQSQAIDVVTADVSEGVVGADIIFLCTPVLQIVPLVKEIIPYLKPGAILTDVGSTKCYLGSQITSLLPDSVRYIGGHPMAGREKSGFLAADKDLFRNKWYILTPSSDSCTQAVVLLKQVLMETGARVTTMDVMAHDQCAAIISHIPHLAAAAIVNLLAEHPDSDNLLRLAGGGFRDTTRIASSNAEMWADICMTNETAITANLEKLQLILQVLGENIRHGDRQAVYGFFRSAQMRRDELLAHEMAF